MRNVMPYYNTLHQQGQGVACAFLQLQLCMAAAGLIGRQTDARFFEHEPRCHAGIRIVVLIAVVHHFRDARLDDGLGALVAGKEGHIHRALSGCCGHC